MGLSPGQPRTSVDGQEARMPIKPVGEAMPVDVAGFGWEKMLDRLEGKT